MKKLLIMIAVISTAVGAMANETWTHFQLETSTSNDVTFTYELRNIYDWDEEEWTETKNELNILYPWRDFSSNLYFVAVAAQNDVFESPWAEREFRIGVGATYVRGGFTQFNTIEAQAFRGLNDTARFKNVTQYEVQGWDHGEPFVRYELIVNNLTDNVAADDHRFVGGWGLDTGSVNIYVYYMYRLQELNDNWVNDDNIGVGFRGRF